MPAELEVHRSDLWWADVPNDKRRPVLVLTRERMISRLTKVLVAPVTTTVRGIVSEVPLSRLEGLPRNCAANFDNLFTIDMAAFVARIGRLDATRSDEMCRALRFAAAC